MRSDPDALTYAIGDVHGCLGKLVRLLDVCTAHAAGRRLRIVLLGDYIDRGPDSRAVVERLIAMQESAPQDVICLRGNHEAMLLAALEEGGETVSWWFANGGATTLASYGAAEPADVPSAHLRWFRALALCHDDGRRYFVHAGVDPAAALAAQSTHDQLWIREPFLSSTDDFGRLIVHGHTPLMHGRPELRPNRLNLDTGAVFGGPLTAAAFTAQQAAPVAFLTDDGTVTAP